MKAKLLELALKLALKLVLKIAKDRFCTVCKMRMQHENGALPQPEHTTRALLRY